MKGNPNHPAPPKSGLRRLLSSIRLWISAHASREIYSPDDLREIGEHDDKGVYAIGAAFAPVKRWAKRRESWIGVISGLMAGAVLLVFQNIIDAGRFQQSVSVENLRYVRELSHPGSQYRPFSSMDLSGQVLNGLIIDDADLRGADFSGAEMFDVSARGAKLEGANFKRVGIYSSDFSKATLEEVEIRGGVIRDSDFVGATFLPQRNRFWQNDDLIIVNSNFTGAHFEGAEMKRWVIARTSLREAHMTKSEIGQIQRSDLRGADFTGATMRRRSVFDNCYDDLTVWPEGFDPPPSSPKYCGQPKIGIPGRGPAPWRPGARDPGVGDT